MSLSALNFMVEMADADHAYRAPPIRRRPLMIIERLEARHAVMMPVAGVSVREKEIWQQRVKTRRAPLRALA